MEEEKSETSESGAGSTFLAFLLGAAAGAGIALLMAPKTGNEVREKIKGLAGDAMDKGKEYARNMQEKAKGMVQQGKEAMEKVKENPSVATAMEAGKDVMGHAKEQMHEGHHRPQ